MWISRVRVNGGFLAGLDVSLTPGLNVIIGARGTGKTTLLELIRHALGIEHADAAHANRQRKAIAELLGSGEVILDVVDDTSTKHVIVDSRGAGRSSETQAAALVLGQNELEGIASDRGSRLRLIDLRATVVSAAPSVELAGERTRQIAAANARLEEINDRLGRRSLLEKDRADLADREARQLSRLGRDGAVKRELLRSIESQMLQVGELRRVVLRAAELADELALHQQEAASRAKDLGRLQLGFVAAEAAETLASVQRSAADSLASIGSFLSAIRRANSELAVREDQLRVEAEPVRRELEEAETGLGQVTAQLRSITAEITSLDQDESEADEIRALITALQQERDIILDEMEAWQETLYEARQNIASQVSADLQNHVVVDVKHLADPDRLRTTLEQALQGSGLQFRPLAEAIAKNILPRQLLRLVEANDVEGFAIATGIAKDRAARAIGALSTQEALASIAMCSIDDQVDFLLRVGTETRSVESLSTGQKCAVTLPIVLSEKTRILVLDQPEDHLDNAYLVRNVVTALTGRSGSGAQTIVATHNANIPVLGSASTVVELTSDGQRGFVAAADAFNAPSIVKAITELMEGGREAFRLRANFYGKFDSES